MSTERYVEGCALVLRAVREASGDRRRIRFDVVTSEQPEKMDIERAWREGLAARNVGGVDLVLRFGGDVFEAFHVLVDADVLVFAQMNQIVACSSDLQVSFYDESTYKLHKCFHCPSSQMCMTWCPEARSLFTAGVSGVVYAWDAQFMEEKYHMGGLSRDGVCVVVCVCPRTQAPTTS